MKRGQISLVRNLCLFQGIILGWGGNDKILIPTSKLPGSVGTDSQIGTCFRKQTPGGSVEWGEGSVAVQLGDVIIQVADNPDAKFEVMRRPHIAWLWKLND